MIHYKKLPEDIHQRIGFLDKFFRSDSNIVFVYLFGGMLKERQSPLSDVDIAVYVKDIQSLDRLALFSRLTDFLGTDEIDLVILNSAPISITGRILQNRKVLVDKRPAVRHIYESVTLRKYFDFAVKERNILQRRYGIG